jgi:hypothetical protein
MRLQLIASEVQGIPEPVEEIKRVYINCESIKVVKTAEDIDALNLLLNSGLPAVQNKMIDKVNLSSIETKVILARAYYDPNSVFDNFI